MLSFGGNQNALTTSTPSFTGSHQENATVTTTGVSVVDAVTNRLKEHKKKGKRYYDKGVQTLEKNYRLAKFLQFDDAINCFYRSAISYKTCGRWRNAGDALAKCAETHKFAKMLEESAALYYGIISFCILSLNMLIIFA
jgi:hypothetical protein